MAPLNSWQRLQRFLRRLPLQPFPRVTDLLIKPGKFRPPTQKLVRLIGITDEEGRITRAARAYLGLDRQPGNSFARPNDLGYRCSVAITEVERTAGVTCLKPLKRAQMGVRKIAHMHVVADASDHRASDNHYQKF